MTNTQTPKKSKTKMALGAFAGFALMGIAAASAANLGMSANNELGAGVSVTASCQPAESGADINVGFSTPAYNSNTQGFDVSTVELSSIAEACYGNEYQVVVADVDGAELGSSEGVITGSNLSASLDSAVDSAAVGAVSVVIYS